MSSSPTPPPPAGEWPVAPAPSFADWSPPSRERRPPQPAPPRPPTAADAADAQTPPDRERDGRA